MDDNSATLQRNTGIETQKVAVAAAAAADRPRKSVRFCASCKSHDGFDPLETALRRVLLAPRLCSIVDFVEALGGHWKPQARDNLPLVSKLVRRLLRMHVVLSNSGCVALAAVSGSQVSHMGDFHAASFRVTDAFAAAVPILLIRNEHRTWLMGILNMARSVHDRLHTVP
jgi:hypothetical protein